jgi:acyl-CoA synthetase (NDP forming)
MLKALFQPRGVVVVGASRNPAKLGYGVARNLIVSGYRGALHFVNPGGGYSSIGRCTLTWPACRTWSTS